MASRLTEVPERINAGTSVELTLGYPDYPADDGWTLVLYFNGTTANSVTINGADVVANGKNFDVTITAAKTSTMGTGAPADGSGLKWIARVTKGSIIKDADEGDVIVDPDPATAGAYQSQAEKDLAAINAVIAGRITSDLESYQIGGRALTKTPLKNLLVLRSSLEARVNAEKRGGAFGPAVLPRFMPIS
jgi:hypothetical protein